MATVKGWFKDEHADQVAPVAGGNWRAALGEHKEVIVWLRSGTKISGTVTEWHHADGSQSDSRTGAASNSIVRLDEVTLTFAGGVAESAQFVLVPVEDIELIAKLPAKPRVSPSNPGASSAP